MKNGTLEYGAATDWYSKPVTFSNLSTSASSATSTLQSITEGFPETEYARELPGESPRMPSIWYWKAIVPQGVVKNEYADGVLILPTESDGRIGFSLAESVLVERKPIRGLEYSSEQHLSFKRMTLMQMRTRLRLRMRYRESRVILPMTLHPSCLRALAWRRIRRLVSLGSLSGLEDHTSKQTWYVIYAAPY